MRQTQRVIHIRQGRQLRIDRQVEVLLRPGPVSLNVHEVREDGIVIAILDPDETQALLGLDDRDSC